MTIEKYIEPVFFKEKNDIANITIKELIGYLHKYKIDSIYLTENKFPVYLFESIDFIDAFLNNELEDKIQSYIEKHKKEIFTLKYNTNIVDAYNYMRSKNLKRSAVVKDNKLIGEVTFKIISSKIADIVIKDPLTGVFNEKYFEILTEEYKDFDKPIGIIYINFKNIGIIEGLYGEDKVFKILKALARLIKSSVRDIDFVFRNNNLFKLLTFSNLEVTKKIVERIKSRLDSFEIDGLKMAYSLAFSHIPELQNNILLAIDEIENKLIG
jgi:diguanylate cyclase (GGDEF)-like protein